MDHKILIGELVACSALFLLSQHTQTWRLMYHAIISTTKVCLQGLDVMLSLFQKPFSSGCSRRSATPKPRVVIIGASFGGLYALRKLWKDFDITVIDYKTYVEYTPGILRALVEPMHVRELTCAVPTAHCTFVHAEVVDIGPHSVRVCDVRTGQHVDIPFDYLFGACGSEYPRPIRATPQEPMVDDRVFTWVEENVKLDTAETVLVIGGGPVGVELAAEIATTYPNKRVTIVDMAPTVCSTFPRRSVAYMTNWLRRHNVQLELGVRIAGSFPNLAITDEGCELTDGRRLQADLVYRCTGFQPNSNMFRHHFASHIDPRGNVLVNDHMQLEGYPQIFVVGDVMFHRRSNEVKLAHTAELNAHMACENLKRLHRGDPLLKYPEGMTGGPANPKIYCVSLGKYDGTLSFNGLVINGGLPSIAKWFIEWTKVKAFAERPVGVMTWNIADVVSMWVGRYIVRSDRASSKQFSV